MFFQCSKRSFIESKTSDLLISDFQNISVTTPETLAVPRQKNSKTLAVPRPKVRSKEAYDYWRE
jgi:hypothetical protein